MYDISQTKEELERGNNRIKELFNKLNINNHKENSVSGIHKDSKAQIDLKDEIKEVNKLNSPFKRKRNR